ncbi:hypothetical protein A8C56_10505 [Niabella ginsenosidivorans]|uniref:Peptidase M1 membrane alanine aminopeptidase domain-containing protein n=1 Tax=Niabella ginsenosidivorans TaxID=1176587 RepID=A0A1A9I131_9BACT|nr:M1 family aminopeptidase [Niabella ginsenosidivorans]ANH81358.1 hypothetical protein A8C56_10505 [Niabella ginsenosidivorans]
MFKEICSFELKTGFKKPATYIYFGILFLLTLLIGLASGGFFATAKSDSNVTINSAASVAGVLIGTGGNIFSILVCIILISIAGTAIQKDYQYNIYPLFFTKPISKAGYFWGRLSGSLAVAVFVFSGLALGYLTGTLLCVGKPGVGPFKLMNYLQPFLLFTLPNIILLGTIFFSLTTFLRSTMASYIFAIIFMVVLVASGAIGEDMDHKMLAAMLDPLGEKAFRYITAYWTPQEKNNNLIPLTGVLLYNRLLWIGVAVVICIVGYTGFNFSQYLQPLRFFKRASEADWNADPAKKYDRLPKVMQNLSGNSRWVRLLHLTRFEFRKALKKPFFFIILLLCLGMLVLTVRLNDLFSDAPTYLVTHTIVSMVMGIFPFFGMIFLIFSAGTVIWRNKETKMDELIGVTPVSNSLLFLSRLMALSLVLLVLYAIAALTGILLQLYAGSGTVDLWQYVVAVIRDFFEGIVIIGACLAIQCFTTDKYLGFFLSLVPILLLPIVFSFLQWNGDLYDFNGNGDMRPYSDMNGFGGDFINWPFFRVYWMGMTGLLCMLGILLYPRGKERSLKARWRLSKEANTFRFRLLLALLVLITAGTGAFIFYQQNILQDASTPKVQQGLQAAFEKRYKRYEGMAQPRIVSVTVDVELFTKSKSFHARGLYTLKNKIGQPIDTVYIKYEAGKKSRFRFLKSWLQVPATLISNDQEYGVQLFRLQQPLQPGDSIVYRFDVVYSPRGLLDRIHSEVVSNGTFISNALFPMIGYDPRLELGENKARKDYGLPPKARMAKVDDTLARRYNYISHDADWIRFEATVSTDEGQIALAPGYLQKEWKAGGRHYYQYRMDSPILNFYSFLSAAYRVKKDHWNGVAIEICYQQGHEYNLDRMIKSVKRSLDYYTKNFGPYQHRQVRIIEFPRYRQYAQSFPNTIPYSEDIGFILKVKEGPGKIDLPFYVTAHEVAHQWWAHQVIGGDVQGSVLMSETMSQYSALMVMEKEYGKDGMRRFLKREMDHYLRGRTLEGKGELPLMLCENQQYIHYNKGSVVLYALKDFIGEEALNNALRAYINKNRYYGPLYTNSVELVNDLKKATPDSLQYLVSDLFEKITIYENYVKALDYKKLPDGSYKVTLTVGSAKFYADSVGKQKRAAVNDYMDIGVFAEKKANGNENPLILQRIKMVQPEQTFIFTVHQQPVKAGIDPYLKLIDRTPGNNVARFGTTPEKVDLDPNKPQLNFQLGDADE